MSDTTQETSQQFAERARTLHSFGRSPDAVAELRTGLASFPEDPELLSLLSHFEFFTGDKAAGVEAARATLTVRPNDYRATTVLLEHAVVEERFDEAREFAEAQIANYPDYGPAFLNLAHAQLNASWAKNRAGTSTAEEREAWGIEIAENTRRGIALDPEGEETLRRATHLFKHVNLKAEAIKTLDQGLALYPNSEDLLLLASELKAADDIEESKILLGVLAENPQQRSAARKLNFNIWGRFQHLSAIVPWMLVALILVASFVADTVTGSGNSTRTERKFVEAFLLLPIFFLFGLARFKIKALPRGYLRRMLKPVWWVWLGLVILIAASLLMILVAFVLVMRMQPTSMEMNGPYMGGVSALIGFLALMAIVSEFLIMWARFRSEAKNRLYPVCEEGVQATRADLREMRWLLIRIGVGLFIAVFPLFGANLVFRPETLGGFAAVAVAVAVPPMVRFMWVFGRLAIVSEKLPLGRVLGYAAGMVSVLSIAAVLLFMYEHILQVDPPPTPWELKMQEQQSDMTDNLGDLDLPDLSEFEDLDYGFTPAPTP